MNMISDQFKFEKLSVYIILLLYPFHLTQSESFDGVPQGPSDCDTWNTCSQICQVSSGSTFNCSCMDGFYLEDDARSCSLSDPTIQIVYALNAEIKITNANGTATFSVTQENGKGQNVGVTVDVFNGIVYWTDVSLGNEGVYKANINGTGAIETVIDIGLVLPEGIAFDWVTGNLYIVDPTKGHIIVCSPSGSMCSVLQKQLHKPRDIVLHPIFGLMFWTDWGDNCSIMRASMDGTFAVPIVPERIKWPNALAVDLGRNRLYWADAFYDKIETSTLTGSDRQMIPVDNLKHPFSLAVLGDFIFWSDWELKGIQSCSKLACKQDSRTVTKTPTMPNGIVIFHSTVQPRILSNRCLGKCSHICVLSENYRYSCKCPVGYKLDLSKRTCINDRLKPTLLIGHDKYLNAIRLDSIGNAVTMTEEIRIGTLKNIGAIAYNPVNHTLFISDLTLKSIVEYNFSNRQTRIILNKGLDSVKSMAFDPIGENLYWVDSVQRRIEVFSCRTGTSALISAEKDQPQSIILVPEERIDGFYDTIKRISLNGTSQATVKHRTVKPEGLTTYDNRIFWIDHASQLVYALVVGPDQEEEHLYIGRIKNESAKAFESYNTNFLASLTITVYDTTLYENLMLSHECSSSKIPKCSHICLISAEVNVGTCVCPEDMQLNPDNSTCSKMETCVATQFQCNNKRCIDNNMICDGIPECDDAEDEQMCPASDVCNGESSFMCESDGSCIHPNWKCDGERDCPGGEDETNCKNECTLDTEFQCKNGRCVPLIWKCDHQPDCVDGEDEIGCNQTCPGEHFPCKTGGQCIPFDWICDGDFDCADATDEHNQCGACSPDSFRCLDHHCIPGFLVCNRISDCSDGSDELNCISASRVANFYRKGSGILDECAERHSCEHFCVNTHGSFKCACHKNYALRADLRRCKWIGRASQGLTKKQVKPTARIIVPQPQWSSTGWWIFLIAITLLVSTAVLAVLYRKKIHVKLNTQQSMSLVSL